MLQSLPWWERGLKFIKPHNLALRIKSLPSWERGLKSVWYTVQNLD